MSLATFMNTLWNSISKKPKTNPYRTPVKHSVPNTPPTEGQDNPIESTSPNSSVSRVQGEPQDDQVRRSLFQSPLVDIMGELPSKELEEYHTALDESIDLPTELHHTFLSILGCTSFVLVIISVAGLYDVIKYLFCGCICLVVGDVIGRTLGHYGTLGGYLVCVTRSFKSAYEVSSMVCNFLSGVLLLVVTFTALPHVCANDSSMSTAGSVLAYLVLMRIAWQGFGAKLLEFPITIVPSQVLIRTTTHIGSFFASFIHDLLASLALVLACGCQVVLFQYMSAHFFPSSDSIQDTLPIFAPIVVHFAGPLLHRTTKPLVDKIFSHFFVIYGWPLMLAIFLASNASDDAYIFIAVLTITSAIISLAADYLLTHIQNVTERHYPKIDWATVPYPKKSDFPKDAKAKPIPSTLVKTDRGTDLNLFSKIFPISNYDDKCRVEDLENCLAEVLALHRFSMETECTSFYGGDLFFREDKAQYLRLLLPQQNQNLGRYMERNLDAHVILRITYQIATALSKLHRQKICHCDVKVANIMINKRHDAILIDFDRSKPLTQELVDDDIEACHVVFNKLYKRVHPTERDGINMQRLGEILANENKASLLDNILGFRDVFEPTI